MARLPGVAMLVVVLVASVIASSGCARPNGYLDQARRGEVPYPFDLTTDELLDTMAAELEAGDLKDMSALSAYLRARDLTPTQEFIYAAQEERAVTVSHRLAEEKLRKARRRQALKDVLAVVSETLDDRKKKKEEERSAALARLYVPQYRAAGNSYRPRKQSDENSSSTPTSEHSATEPAGTYRAPTYRAAEPPLSQRFVRVTGVGDTARGSAQDLSSIRFFRGYGSGGTRVRGSVIELGNLEFVRSRSSDGTRYTGTTTRVGNVDYHNGRDSNGNRYRSYTMDIGGYLTERGRSSDGTSYRGSSYVVGNTLYHRYRTSDGRTITGTTTELGGQVTTKLREW